MLRKVLVYLVLALFSLESMGCAGKRAVVRGQSPDHRIDAGRVRRRIRKDIEPVLDATSKVRRKVEPAWEATRDVTRKDLALAGCLALLGGSWWVDQTINDGDPFAGNGPSPRSGSAGAAREKSKDDPDDRRHRKEED